LDQTQRGLKLHKECLFLICNVVSSKSLPKYTHIMIVTHSLLNKLKMFNFSILAREQTDIRIQTEIFEYILTYF